jgi:N-sulfoglucosamine sulfohydrolase
LTNRNLLKKKCLQNIEKQINMNKVKSYIKVLFFLASLVLMSCTGNRKDNHAGKSLNILFLSSDDLNYNSIGAFGSKVEDITPNIDKLAEEGIRFTHAYNNTAVCQPCRQTWLTGLYPHNNGAEGLEPIHGNITTLPGLLKQAGYFNGILGKEIHHQPTENFFWDFIPFKTEKDSVWRKGDSRNPSLFYEYSKRFFEMAKNENKPFFFSVNSHDPHRPFAASASDSVTYGSNLPPVTRIFKPEEIEMLGYLPDIPDVRKEVAQYYNSVYRSDQTIGAVLKALEESGLKENTLVIYLSDNGAAFPFAKSQCYLNSTKAPLIIRWPGKTTPGTVDTRHLVSGIDLMPTILEAAGLNIPENLDGASFLPILEDDENYDGNSYVFTSYYQVFAKVRYPMRSIQNQNFGYIYNFWADNARVMRGDATGGLTWKAMVKAAETDPEIAKRVELYSHRVKEEFYDLKNDPDALYNLIDDPQYSAQIDEFRELMLQAMIKYKDPAYETYRDRHKEGTIEKFMELQDEKAKHTKPNVLF